MQSFYDYLCEAKETLESMDASRRESPADTFLSDEEIVHAVLANAGVSEIAALLLHGSRVDGRCTGKSDYDLLIVHSNKQQKHFGFVRGGASFSCNCISFPIPEADNNADYLRFYYPSRVIYDKDGSGLLLKKAIDDCCENYKAKEDCKDYKEFLKELISRMRRRDADESFYKAFFIYCAPIFLAECNGQISLGPKRNVALLLRDDPELVGLFGKVLLPESGADEAERFYQSAFHRKVLLHTKDQYCSNIPDLNDVVISDASENAYSLGSCLRKICDPVHVFVHLATKCNRDYLELFQLLKTFDPDTCQLLMNLCKTTACERIALPVAEA